LISLKLGLFGEKSDYKVTLVDLENEIYPIYHENLDFSEFQDKVDYH